MTVRIIVLPTSCSWLDELQGLSALPGVLTKLIVGEGKKKEIAHKYFDRVLAENLACVSNGVRSLIWNRDL